MNRFLLGVLVCALVDGFVVHAQKSAAVAPVRVFVTSAGAANGFTDPSKDNQDTTKDLRDVVKGHKSIALAESRDDAVIVLTVMNRETAQVTAGLLGGPARDRTVRVKFICNDFETEMSASAQGGTLGSGGAWGRAAGKVINQVDDWVKANRSKLPQDGRGRPKPQH
jgi:hypothetical protein